MFSHGYIKNDFDVQKWAASGVHGKSSERIAGIGMEEKNNF